MYHLNMIELPIHFWNFGTARAGKFLTVHEIAHQYGFPFRSNNSVLNVILKLSLLETVFVDEGSPGLSDTIAML